MPIPTGWQWLKRLALAVLIVTLLLAAAWYAWLRETQRRMDALIAELRARGEMVSWAELEITPVPDEENAARYLTRAATAMVMPPKPPSAYERAKAKAAGLPTTQPDTGPDATRAHVAANTQPLALLRQARGCTQAYWVAKPPSGPPIPVYANQSDLAKLARDAALLALEEGNDRAAVELWRDIEAQARCIGSGPVVLIGGLVSFIIDGIGADTMLTLAPKLRMGDEGLSPAEVRQLISELLDDSYGREAIARGWEGERTNWTDTYLANPQKSFMAPLLVAHMHKYCLMLDGLASDTRALRTSPPFELDEYVRLIGIIPQFGGVTDDVIKHAVLRRAVAMILAVRLYRHERGEYPSDLGVLLPNYLSAIPTDPRSGTAIGYVLDEGRPVLIVAPAKWPPVGKIPSGTLRGTSFYDVLPQD